MAPRLFGETPRRTRHHFWRNGIAGRRRHRNVLALFGPLVRCEHRKRVRFMVPRCSMYGMFTYIYHKLYYICIPIRDPKGILTTSISMYCTCIAYCILQYWAMSSSWLKQVRIHGRSSTSLTLSGNLCQGVFSHSCRFPITIITCEPASNFATNLPAVLIQNVMPACSKQRKPCEFLDGYSN